MSDIDLRSYRSVVLGVAWRTVHNALTTPNIVIPTLAFPFFFFIAFAGGLSQLQHLPGFFLLALSLPQTGQAYRCAQFERFGLLATSCVSACLKT